MVEPWHLSLQKNNNNLSKFQKYTNHIYQHVEYSRILGV